MGIISELSTIRLKTLDDYVFTGDYQTREEAFKALKEYAAKVEYKEAVIVDTNTGSEVLSLRVIK
jgi:hypothetical protein